MPLQPLPTRPEAGWSPELPYRVFAEGSLGTHQVPVRVKRSTH
jgi:hypothetical protein